MFLARSWSSFSKGIGKRLRRGDVQGAMKLAAKYSGRHPKDPRGWYVLGVEAARSSDYATAETAFASAARLAPDDPWLSYKAASMQVLGHRLKSARRSFEALSRDSAEETGAQALAQIGLAEVSLQEHDRDAAIAHAKLAERLIPADRGEWLTELALVVFPIRGLMEMATRLLTGASANGGDAISHLLLAALIKDGDPSEARRQVELGRQKWAGSPRQFTQTRDDLERRVRAIRAAQSQTGT